MSYKIHDSPPTFDENGYPTEETLKTIREWPWDHWWGLWHYVQRAWRYPDYFSVGRKYVRMSTGGWSGNEMLIGALMDNVMIWNLAWLESRIGGHYTFKKEVLSNGQRTV